MYLELSPYCVNLYINTSLFIFQYCVYVVALYITIYVYYVLKMRWRYETSKTGGVRAGAGAGREVSCGGGRARGRGGGGVSRRRKPWLRELRVCSIKCFLCTALDNFVFIYQHE